MAYDGFLGLINETDPVPSNVRDCIDKFLDLPKEEQNVYFSMYDNGMDYSEKKDEFGKVIPYSMSEWIKTALEHIKSFDKDDCTNYALSKSVANIGSFKIINDKDKSIKFDSREKRVPIYIDEEFNRTVYSDGSIINNITGEEIVSGNFNNKIVELNKEVTGNEYISPNAKDDKETFDRINKKANPDLAAEKKSENVNEDNNTGVIEITAVENNDNTTEQELVEIKNDDTIYVPNDGRIDFISWDEFFIGVAKLAAKRSKDPNTQVGAVLVRNNRIISTGYNGMPYISKKSTDSDSNDKLYHWGKSDDIKYSKYTYVVHAELNAILNARQSVEGCTLYCTLFPCNECAKAIIQSGIKEIVYVNRQDRDIFDIAEIIIKNAGINIRVLDKENRG